MYYIRIMADEMTDFLWRVSTSGYKWSDLEAAPLMNADALEGKIRVLTDGVPLGVQYAFSRYTPLLEFSGLFRTFALDTEPTEDGILAFANKYGTLGLQASVLIPSLDGRSNVGAGETLASWTGELLDMRLAVNLWDAARHRNTSGLGRLVHWNDYGVYYQPDASRFAAIAGKDTRPDILARLERGDLIAPAYWHLQRVVNEKLDRHNVTGRLLWDSSDRTGQQLTVRLVPKSLIGCLWLQLAKALEGKDYRQCENCKLWFEIGGSRGARADKKFCSATCKAGLNRKVRERAIALRAAGRTPAQIAKELGKDIIVVKGWISK
jgi:hypothetical protein